METLKNPTQSAIINCEGLRDDPQSIAQVREKMKEMKLSREQRTIVINFLNARESNDLIDKNSGIVVNVQTISDATGRTTETISIVSDKRMIPKSQ